MGRTRCACSARAVHKLALIECRVSPSEGSYDGLIIGFFKSYTLKIYFLIIVSDWKNNPFKFLTNLMNDACFFIVHQFIYQNGLGDDAKKKIT